MNHKRSTVAGWLMLSALFAGGAAAADTIRIGIGHQSMVTNTVSGGIVLEKLDLISKYLPRDGEYQDVDYDIQFKDYTSGPPITNQMMANKLDFGVMGDYPLIVNGAKFEQSGNAESRFIAVTGYNAEGTGNGIVVPVDSPARSLADLNGKAISTPVGSAAWGMTLKALRDAGLDGQVTLINQAPPVGAANIAAGKIDAHADFCPWSEIMEFRGTGRKIFDGSQAGVPTFHGTVVRSDYAEKYPQVVEAVLLATLEAQKWIRDDPIRAAIKVSEWTGVEKEVLYLYFSNGGITTQDASIKPEWLEAMKYDHALLSKEKDIPPLNFERWVDDRYIKAAYAKAGADYEEARAELAKPVAAAPDLDAAEIWFADGGVSGYHSVADMIEAHRAALAGGKAINATYVYDADTGLKLFGKVAYYVRDGDGYAAYMLRDDAEHQAGEAPVYGYQSLIDGEDAVAAATD